MKKIYAMLLFSLLSVYPLVQATNPPVIITNETKEKMAIRLMDNTNDPRTFGVRKGHDQVSGDRKINGRTMQFNQWYFIEPGKNVSIFFRGHNATYQRIVVEKMEHKRNSAHFSIGIVRNSRPEIRESSLYHSPERRVDLILSLNTAAKQLTIKDQNEESRCMKQGVLLKNSTNKELKFRLMTRADKNKYGVAAHENMTKRKAWYYRGPDSAMELAFAQNKYNTLAAHGDKSKVCLEFTGGYQRVIIGKDTGATKGGYFTLKKGTLHGKIENGMGYTLTNKGATSRLLEVTQ